MSDERFDPKAHFIKTKGNKDYLPVAARVLWFRDEGYSIAAGWSIRTRKVDGGLKEGFAEFYCEITDPDGRVVATGSNAEDKEGFVDFLMKAETGAIGRALAAAGYGTMAALDEGEVVDAPIERGRPIKVDDIRQVAKYPKPPDGALLSCPRCEKPMTQGQATLSEKKLGARACPACQRELAALAAA